MSYDSKTGAVFAETMHAGSEEDVVRVLGFSMALAITILTFFWISAAVAVS